MNCPALIQRREIWIPTIWGWFALLLTGSATIVLAARILYPFMALNEPVGSHILVVEGWMNADGLDQALEILRSGQYRLVITTGGPMDKWPGSHDFATYAERAAIYMSSRGHQDAEIVAVPAPATQVDRTFLNAILVRKWAARSGLTIDRLDVVSLGPHARRSRALYHLAFDPETRIGVYAAKPSEYDPDAWWRTSAGAKNVLGEVVSWLWVTLFFQPDRQQDRE